ncbi:hypothetical protein EVAR_75874_1 [Eumeta japonica]|uniref:Uncharacterized protein n=1 Tax=Eumeta variegata TaxID=151549 RepID=A0A4C1TGP1_EUMVA|nr:hypothetical protein EVAR_75874_1 [Eumeta japonica]
MTIYQKKSKTRSDPHSERWKGACRCSVEWTKVMDALTHALKLKWKWAAHIARMSDNRWTKRTTSWRGPDGKRSIGRPYARWSDDIKGVAGNWLEEGNNREKWAEMEEAFTQKGLHSDSF